jgi:hypothetical protein
MAVARNPDFGIAKDRGLLAHRHRILIGPDKHAKQKPVRFQITVENRGGC